jgi:hypothetical protein
MIYEDKSVPGQQLLECTRMIKDGVVRYIEDNFVYEEENDPKDRKYLVTVLEVSGVPETPRHNYGIVVPNPDTGELCLLKPRWKSITEVKTAAKAIALFTPNHLAYAVVINDEKKPLKRRKSHEDDPEAFERDFYEDNGYIKSRVVHVEPSELYYPDLSGMKE